MWSILKSQIKTRGTFRWSVIVLVAALCVTVQSQAQNTPLISGGIGFLTATKGGNTSYFPTAEPLIAFPLGSNLLVEGRAALLEDFFPNGQAGYSHFHFVALSYLQLNYIANAHATVVAGEFLTPFGTYNERLTPIWISNFEDAPLILNLGIGTGSSVGGMLRGSALSNSRYSIDYAAYYSAASSNQNFSSRNGWGGRASVYLPAKRLEFGTSYSRATEDKHVNDFGLHVWWEPASTPFKLRSEYAHGAHAQGYWLESDYRLSRFGSETSLVGRLEPVFRWQQTFRNSPSSRDGLPAADTQRADFGLDYHLPHELRINTSYSRQLSSTGNSNIWETGIVYRFLTPTWKGK